MTDMTMQMQKVNENVAGWLARYSVALLRISLGMIFFIFGALKFMPDTSPAQELVIRTFEKLSFGLIPGPTALLITATAECFIGLTLMTGKFLRTGLAVLAVSIVGIMSPLVLFTGDLFPGAPTLEGQYVLKDIVLVTAGLVVAARALGGQPEKA